MRHARALSEALAAIPPVRLTDDEGRLSHLGWANLLGLVVPLWWLSGRPDHWKHIPALTRRELPRLPSADVLEGVLKDAGRASDATTTVRLLSAWMLHVGRGGDPIEALRGWCAHLGPVQDPEDFLDAVAALQSAAADLEGIATMISVAMPSHATDAWLAAAARTMVGDHGGQKKLARLLRLMAPSLVAIREAAKVHEALQQRTSSPQGLDQVYQAWFARRDRVPVDEPIELRGVPLILLFRQWLLAIDNPDDTRPLGAWCRAFSQATRALGLTLEEHHLWPRPSPADGRPAVPLPSSTAACLGALDHVVTQTSNGFAARWAPSLDTWPEFERIVLAWIHRTGPERVLLEPSQAALLQAGSRPPPSWSLWSWRGRGPERTSPPWSASRLFGVWTAGHLKRTFFTVADLHGVPEDAAADLAATLLDLISRRKTHFMRVWRREAGLRPERHPRVTPRIVETHGGRSLW